MTQCCAAMLDYLFHEAKLHRVCIRCATGNTRSCAIPERLGFRREGLEREAELLGDRWVDLWNWAVLEDEWRGA
jgi:ribosomal-protein-serine acetyltransferase